MKFFYFIMFLLLVGCKTTKDVALMCDTSKGYTYGDTIFVDFKNIYEDESRKSFRNRHYKSLEVEVEGGKYLGENRIVVNDQPKKNSPKKIKVNYHYKTDEKNFDRTRTIKLSFDQKLTIDFSGGAGQDKKDRGNRLINSLIGSDGRTGKDADNGTKGEDGNNLYIKIWKNKNGDLYSILTKNLDSGAEFYYYYKRNGQPINIITDGGNGGDGGDGGDGADGDDAKIEDGESVAPGSGGRGGNGGDGGDGGSGGNILIHIHPNAKTLMKNIKMSNSGGKPGKGGKAGEGGKAGDPLEGNKQVEQDGSTGTPGKRGQPGKPGEQKSVEVKEFSIQ